MRRKCNIVTTVQEYYNWLVIWYECLMIGLLGKYFWGNQIEEENWEDQN